MSKGKKWTLVEDERLRALYPNYRNDTIAILIGRSLSAITGRAFILGLKKSNSHMERIRMTEEKFKKGHIPANKGRKIEEYVSETARLKMAATQFTAGHIPHNYKGGRIIDGIYMVNIDHKPVNLKRSVWEQHNGAIPQGYCIVCKDGNPRNCDISNLEMRKLGFNLDRTKGARHELMKRAWRTRRRNSPTKYGYVPEKTIDEDALRRRAKLDCMPNPLEFLTKQHKRDNED